MKHVRFKAYLVLATLDCDTVSWGIIFPSILITDFCWGRLLKRSAFCYNNWISHKTQILILPIKPWFYSLLRGFVTIVYHTQDCLFLASVHCLICRKGNTVLQQLDLFLSSGKRVGRHSARLSNKSYSLSLDLLVILLNSPSKCVIIPHLRMWTDQVSDMMCYFLHITRQTNFRQHVILVGATFCHLFSNVHLIKCLG